MTETRYYVAEKVGAGTFLDPFRAKDFDRYPKGSPALDFGDEKVMLVQVTADTTVHDGLVVDAVRLSPGKAVNDVELVAALAKAGVDATWIVPGVEAEDVITVLKQEGHVANIQQGLKGATAFLGQLKAGVVGKQG